MTDVIDINWTPSERAARAWLKGQDLEPLMVKSAAMRGRQAHMDDSTFAAATYAKRFRELRKEAALEIMDHVHESAESPTHLARLMRRTAIERHGRKVVLRSHHNSFTIGLLFRRLAKEYYDEN